MKFIDILSTIATIFATFGSGAALVFFLSKWLGGVWAARILENDKLKSSLEQDLITRKREIYAKLSKSLRVLLANSEPATLELKQTFLENHDEAFLWASDDVYMAVGYLLDLSVQHTSNQGPTPQPLLHAAYQHCLIVMRKDVGFPNSTAIYRVVTFK